MIESELMGVFEQIEREKGISKKDLLVMIETALCSAFRKHSGKGYVFEAHIDSETGIITAYTKKKVVGEVMNDNFQISCDDAKKIDAASKEGDEVKIQIKTEEFGRMAAQTAKQVIMQKIRETEKENLYKELKEKEGTVINGVVHRLAKNNIIIDIGKVEAVLPMREAIQKYNYSIGERIRVHILKVEMSPQGPMVMVSRIHPGLVKALFDIEIPEIHDHTVEIKNIIREPGVRCKVAVVSNNKKVDPIGACVGVHGVRIQAIISELNGERIDLIPYVEDTEKYISNALNPAKVLKVVLEIEKKNAKVTVADEMLSLAIGKAGQNVRLAARLTGWHIDIKSESFRKSEEKTSHDDIINKLSELPGVGNKTAENLAGYGFKSIESIASTELSALEGVSGIGKLTAKKIHRLAQEWVEQNKKETDTKKEVKIKQPASDKKISNNRKK